MSRYSEQFKRDAVALYENNEDLSLNSASAELGINRASLHSWVKKYGTGKRASIRPRFVIRWHSRKRQQFDAFDSRVCEDAFELS